MQMAKTPKPIPIHPMTTPAMARPSPVSAPALAAISLRPILPVITAAMLPRNGNSVRPRIPAIRLTRAIVLVLTPGVVCGAGLATLISSSSGLNSGGAARHGVRPAPQPPDEQRSNDDEDGGDHHRHDDGGDRDENRHPHRHDFVV